MKTFPEYDQFILNHHRSFPKYKAIATEHNYKYVSEMLIDLYFTKKKTGPDIAEIFRSNKSWIYRFFSEIGLVLRPLGITVKPISENDDPFTKDFKLNLNFYEDKLKLANKLGYNYVCEAVTDMYNIKRMSTKKIGTAFESTPNWALHTLKKLNIKRREPSSKIENRLSKTQINKILKDFKQLEIKSDIITNYICVNELNVSARTLTRFLKRQSWQ